MKLNINDEQGIELLHWIFERELKPPFNLVEENSEHEYECYNSTDEFIGWLGSNKIFITFHSSYTNVKDKVCQAFDFPKNTRAWWFAIKPKLKSWMEDNLNTEIKDIR